MLVTHTHTHTHIYIYIYILCRTPSFLAHCSFMSCLDVRLIALFLLLLLFSLLFLAVRIDDDQRVAVTVTRLAGTGGAREPQTHTFRFAHIYPPASQQLGIYRRSVQSLVQGVLDGYNATVFCYGQVCCRGKFMRGMP